MRRINLILVLIFFAHYYGLAQTGKIAGRKKADIYYDLEIYQLALPTYLHLLNKDNENPELNLKAGVCLLNSGKRKEAIAYLEKAKTGEHPLAYYHLGIALHYENRLNEAIEHFQLFKRYATVEEYLKSDVERHLQSVLRAKEFMSKPVKVKIENLGPGINSAFDDYVPLISADESVMIFTSRREGSLGGETDQNGQYFEDLYISSKSGQEWSPAENMGQNINTPSHDAAVSLSADGQKLIIYRMSKNFYGGDLYLSLLDGESWGIPDKIAGEINSEFWEPSACLSADEKMFFFSSNRPGGYGGRDIYMCKKLPDGSWAMPLNLGAMVNTPYDDDAPFFHPDGKTLYFSSKGHSTMGGFDIFKTVMYSDRMWSIPENLGYPINTVDDDIYFVLSTDGRRAYYSTDREGGFGEKDIYVIQMPDEKNELTVIKGTVYREEAAEPLRATITIIDTESNEIQGIYRSNSASGKYVIVLPTDKKYKAIVESEGCYSWSEFLDMRQQSEFKEIQKDIFLRTNGK